MSSDSDNTLSQDGSEDFNYSSEEEDPKIISNDENEDESDVENDENESEEDNSITDEEEVDIKDEDYKKDYTEGSNNGLHKGRYFNEETKSKKCKLLKKEKQIPFNEPKIEKKKHVNIIEKYAKLKGKSLFVRFPHRLTENIEELEKEVRELCTGVIKVRRPRQRSIRFCLVDFDNPEDCNNALKELKKAVKEGKISCVATPKTENDNTLKEIMEKRKKKIEEKRAKKKIKKAVTERERIVLQEKSGFTSTLIVKNIPVNTTISQLRELFPKAVDVKLESRKGDEDTINGTVTLRTPKDATKTRRKIVSINSKVLKMVFAINKGQRKMKQPRQKNSKPVTERARELEKTEGEEEEEECVAPKKRKLNFEKKISQNKVNNKRPVNMKLKPKQKEFKEKESPFPSKKIFNKKKRPELQENNKMLQRRQQKVVPPKRSNKVKKPFKTLKSEQKGKNFKGERVNVN